MGSASSLPESGGRLEAGRSVRGQSIALTRYGTGRLPVILLGGVHGDEPEGYLLAERFEKAVSSSSVRISGELSFYICPRVNPDGCDVMRRTNQNNVDLNRNMPTLDWTGDFTNVKYFPGRAPGSEPETDAVLEMIRLVDPALIISLHSYEKPMINYNGDSLYLAESMSRKNGLEPKGDIGYPTPGSLGTYGGWERNLPVITLEILRGQDIEQVWTAHRDGLIDAAEYYLNHPIPPRKEPAHARSAE